MKLYVERPMMGGMVKMWLVDTEGANKRAITFDKNSNFLHITELTEKNQGEIVTPFMELPNGFFDEFIKAITDYASDNNIKTENENLMKGKMDATLTHLDDMRKIVFKQLQL